ncbi:MAG: hypothetical protein ACLFR0_03955, partial [Alphaproteobacteria bacterium]
IISLPYKVGIWVSHADDVEGEADDIHEIKALERGIPKMSALHEDSLLVQQVASEIMRLKDQWEVWEDQCFHVLKTAPDTMTLVLEYFGEKEAKEYRAFIMGLGKIVARAASELDAFDSVEEEKEGFLGSMIGKIVGGISSTGKDDVNHPANISPAEGSALSQLSAALKI